MAIRWSEVVKDPRYIKANIDEKDLVKKSWYEANVMTDPRYDQSKDAEIRKGIFGEEPKGPSFRAARLGTEIVDREIQYRGKTVRLSEALKIEKAESAARWAAKELKEMKLPPGLREPSPFMAPVVAYEQTYGRLFGGYRALLAGKSPLEGLIKPSEQPRAIDSVIKSDFAKRMGADPATNPEAATWINGLAGWALDLAGIHLIFNVPFKAAKEVRAAYTGIQSKAVADFKSVLSSELEIAGVPKNVAKAQADALFYQQWIKTGMLKKTPGALRQSTTLLKSNPGKLGEFIGTKVKEATANAARQGYTPEVLKRIPKLSGKTTYTQLAEGDVLAPAKGSEYVSKMGEFKKALKGVPLAKVPKPSEVGVTKTLGKDAPSFFTKTKSVKKIMEQKKAYAEFMKGKSYVSYGGGIDKILKVDITSTGSIEYTVKDLESGKIRTHATRIAPREVLIEAPISSKVELIKPFILPKGKSGVFIDITGRAVGREGMDQHGNVLDAMAEKKGIDLAGEDRPDFAMEQGLIYKASTGTINTYVADSRIGTKKQVTDAVNKDVKNTGFKGKVEIEYTVRPKAPPKKLTPKERLIQIRSSHRAFQARKAAETVAESVAEQKPVEVTPPKGATEGDMHSTPHTLLKSGVKAESNKPFVSEERAPRRMYQVTLQTPKGATITYVSEENLIKMREAIRTAPMTKELPKTEAGVPIIKIHDEQLLDLTEMHMGLNPGPALREVRRLYEYMEKMADPVRTAPPEVARTVRQRAIAQNVLIHNIAQVKSAMQRLVPDPKQQEVITAFIEPGGEEAVGDQMTDPMRLVANLIMDGQKRLGVMAKKLGVIKQVLDNYMKHMIKDPLLTPEEVDAKIKFALSTGKISKFVESKMPRVRTESGEVLFPTVASLEAAGYDIVTKNAIDLYDFTMRSEGLAVINAEMAAKMRTVPYVDPRQPKLELFQLMSVKKGTPPRGFRLLRRGVFTQQWASPEAYNAISTVAEPAIGGRTWKKIASTSKRIKFLFPFLHAWNLQRNAIETKGIYGSVKLVMEGAKQLKDPERISQILKMGVNLFRINKMSGGITDEFARSLGKWDIPAKTSEWLFTGLGDSVAMGMVDVLEKQLATSALSTQEVNEMISEVVNTLSGNLAPETMSRIARDIGSVGLIARNWTYSNIREGKGALGLLPNYWSKGQKDFVQKWYRNALLRGFLHLFTAANVVNYMVSKHSYGEGRFTWQNTGRWDFKAMPLVWVDKKTGREFYATGWYGSLGDIVHWLTRPIKTFQYKLNVPVREVAQQVANLDFFTRDRVARDSDNLAEAVTRRIGHAAESFLIPAGIQLEKGKYPTPLGAKVLRIFGIMLASSMRDQDLMKKMFNFKEKKKYKIKDIDRGLYKKLAEGDRAGFMKEASKQQRYRTIEGATGMIRKFENPLSSYFRNLSFQDRREFLDTLSQSEKDRLGEAVRRKRQ